MQRRVYRKRGLRRKHFGGPSEDWESETLVVFSLSCAKTHEVELEAVFVRVIDTVIRISYRSYFKECEVIWF